jgi:hypothetical protein
MLAALHAVIGDRPVTPREALALVTVGRTASPDTPLRALWVATTAYAPGLNADPRTLCLRRMEADGYRLEREMGSARWRVVKVDEPVSAWPAKPDKRKPKPEPVAVPAPPLPVWSTWKPCEQTPAAEPEDDDESWADGYDWTEIDAALNAGRAGEGVKPAALPTPAWDTGPSAHGVQSRGDDEGDEGGETAGG